MGKGLAPDRNRATIAIAAATIATLVPSAFGQVGAIVLSGLIGCAFLRTDAALPHSEIRVSTGRVTGALLLVVFITLLVVLPLAARSTDNYVVQLFDGFYRAGALVFGGGHVVLPLLQSQVVPAGWVSNDAFLAGYGATQAVPGPLFTFAAYLGAVSTESPAGWTGAAIATAAIFLPAFLLVVGTLPFWETLRRYAAIKRAMLGINAAVVGLLLAAFYNPVWTSAINNGLDFCLATAAFALLVFWKLPPWLVVLLAAIVSGLGVG
jgi:chromate transporter